MFFYAIDVLSQKSSEHFREFTNKQYKDFVKAIVNDDKVVIEKCISLIIQNTSLNSIDPNKLTSLDKLYILLCLRSYNIASKLNLNAQTKDEISISLTIDINQILQTLEKLEISHIFEVNCDGITAKGTLPKSICSTNALELVCTSIDELIIKDKTVILSDLTVSEKQFILNNLPLTLVSKITEFVYRQEKILSSAPVFKFDTTKELTFDKEITLSLFNNSIIELIKVLFNTNLRDFYTTEYILYKKFSIPYEAVNNLTPAEINVYFDIIAKDIEQEKRDTDEQQQGTPISSRPK